MQALSRVCPASGDTQSLGKLTDSSDAALTEEYMADKFRALLVTKDTPTPGGISSLSSPALSLPSKTK